MDHIFRVFPNDPIAEKISHAKGIYLYTKDGKKYLDMTAGSTSLNILGWCHDEVNDAIIKQLNRYAHIDYKAWTDENTEELAKILLSRAEHKLDRVYYSGNSGAEACEAAMKMSYQVHYDQGHREKTWFISRTQSYHGATTDALAMGDRPNLDFYKPLHPTNRAHIPQHHPRYMMLPNESLDEYALRSAKELEDKILEIGPEKVCAFLGETIMGGLVGDVPPAPNYWKYIRQVCDKYNVHLILDEVYCGTGTSGKIYCCDWDQVTPDFIMLGKTIAAGYAPISAVVTSSKNLDIIKNGQGRLQHTTTHQAYSLGVAAAIAVQKIIHTDNMLQHVQKVGSFIRDTLINELNDHPFFFDVRGRGLRQSFEYRCNNQNQFGLKLMDEMKEKHGILINGKWHRISFATSLIIEMREAEEVMDKFVRTFKQISKDWK